MSSRSGLTDSLVPKLRLGILKLEAPASRLFLWRGRERTEPVGKQSIMLGFPSGAWETAKTRRPALVQARRSQAQRNQQPITAAKGKNVNRPIYQFTWDDTKARSNAAKHGVTFKQAMSVLRDPLALTIYDEEHSDQEERWITLGQTANGQYLVVVHTFQPTGPDEVTVRIISARKADKDEVNDYLNTPR
jgi:uncharacterized DUF497 family protein